MKMIINGERVDASDGKIIEVYNPATGEQIDTIPSATAEDVERALDAAQAGKEIWANTPLYERCNILKRFADLIVEHKEELAWINSRDTGKSIKDGRAEMGRIDIMIRGYAERANHLYSDCLPDAQPGMEHDLYIVRREPFGVVACIIPFNYPASLLSQKIAPALAMGNAIIVKPATDNPLTVMRMMELLIEAGVPGNVAQVVSGRGSVVGDKLVGSPKIDVATITSSTEAGISVATAAARNLNHSLMELGGNSALVVFDDTDIDKAAAAAAASRTPNAGQTCGASKRFIVQNTVREQFVSALVEKLKAIKVGDPQDESTDVGCLITEKAAAEVEKQVQHTVSQGAKCVLGGKRYNGAFFPMTVLNDVTPDMDAAKDLEIFGPVFTVIGFDTEEEAVKIANNSKYGLTGGVLTNDYKKAMRVATKMQCGGIVVNGDSNCRPPEMAFGGFKMSGLGREGISATLEEMSQLKTYVFKDIR